MNTRTKKLTLNKETLRNLQDSELRHVVGGLVVGAVAQEGTDMVAVLGQGEAQMMGLKTKIPLTGRNCDQPCPSSISDGGTNDYRTIWCGG